VRTPAGRDGKRGIQKDAKAVLINCNARLIPGLFLPHERRFLHKTLKFTLKKTTILIVTLVLAGALGIVGWLRWESGAPRRASLAALERFDVALRSGDSQALLSTTMIPQAVAGRTAPEQVEFLRKAVALRVFPVDFFQIVSW
jgi:hypothetical protein